MSISRMAAGTPARAKLKAQRNREYADSLGWGAQLKLVHSTLNPGRRQWNDVALIDETRKWQARTGLNADGIIDPRTWWFLRVAAGTVKDPAISSRLPGSGPGFYAYRPPHRRFGRPEVIRALQVIAAGWRRDHPRWPRIGVGDISLQGGGPIPGHDSHRLGLDVDLLPARKDGREGKTASNRSATYSRRLTQELVDRIHANGVLQVHFIYFNDPHIRGVRQSKKHGDHLHIRFRPRRTAGPPAAARPHRTAVPRTTAIPLVAARPRTPHVTAISPSTKHGPSGPYGRLVASRPGRRDATFSYHFTGKDVLWTARFIAGETSGRDDVNSRAVIWAMFNRYALHMHRHYPSFWAFLRGYSTPLQPVLQSWRATKRSMTQPDFVRTGGAFSSPPAPPGIPRGQRRRYLDLQARPWHLLPQSARSMAERALKGQIPNPIGNATEFGSTYVYYRDNFGANPNLQQWQRFTKQFAAKKRWIWKPVRGIDQTKNAFFVNPEIVRLSGNATATVLRP
ncbi:hypothetical protein E1264_29095 [Actinomadura sp. KC216]|uniref:penicillin-insensitive murein endopeptidase n=1 Tax=Actinomadura sp. KC216 TaxID=2530370 RepID=UPI00104552AB|nr:penicillin-insensitive murein endopeptidase [Actinomadura sp. KC216]TDB83270.1 hypothetical protein E1264_29095 [Actinomadura sp. KC216]